MQEKSIYKIKCIATCELELGKPLNQEGADLVDLNDMIRDGEIIKIDYFFYDKNGKRIDPK